MQKEEPIITLATYYDPMLAQIVRARLEDNGIPCFVADENMGSVYPMYNTAIGGIKLKIFERDMEKCKAILAEDETATVEEVAGTDEPTDAGVTCPKCGSTNVRDNLAESKRSWLSTIASYISDEKPFHCNKCGNDFE
jgi:hypothetical protein